MDQVKAKLKIRHLFGNSLIRTLRAIVFLIIASSIALSFVTLAVFAYQTFSSEREQTIVAIATSISKSASRSLSLGDFTGLENSLQGTRLPEFICSIRVLNDARSQIASTINRESNCNEDSDSQEHRTFPIADEFELPGAINKKINGFVELNIDHSGLRRRFLHLVIAALMGYAAFLGIVLFFSSRVILQVISPLTESVETASRLKTFDNTLFEKAPIEIRPLLEKLENLFQTKAQLEIDARVAKIAAQVAHDIRSPLSALLMAESQLTDTRDDVRNLIKAALKRIQAIVSDLRHAGAAGKKSSQSNQDSDPVKLDASAGTNPASTRKLTSHVVSSIEAIVTEKIFEYGGHEKITIDSVIHDDVIDKFVSMENSTLNRILSNIINNSIEAFHEDQKPQVFIESRLQGQYCEIVIKDTGRGIPKHLLPLLFNRGKSFNKSGGSGLGLYHAKEAIDAIGGQISIDSELNRGTTVSIRLPIATIPEYFATKVCCTDKSELISIDDDASIHLMWAKKVEAANTFGNSLTHRSFLSPEEFRGWYRGVDASISRIFLVDFSFSKNYETGLDLIESLNLSSHAILVTSMSDDQNVIARCERIGIKLMPKSIAGKVKIEVLKNRGA